MEIKSGDKVVAKNNRERVYEVLYIIGVHASCKEVNEFGKKRFIRLSDLEKHKDV